jgi:hypothetical protein
VLLDLVEMLVVNSSDIYDFVFLFLSPYFEDRRFDIVTCSCCNIF